MPAAAVLFVLSFVSGCNRGGDTADNVQPFCRQMARASADFGGLERRAFTDPARIRPVLARVREIEKVAPDEVAADARLLVTSLEEILVFVESGGTRPLPGRFDFDRFRRAFADLVEHQARVCPATTTLQGEPAPR